MARKLGIGMVYQHFSLFETMTVAENILLGLDEKIDLKSLAAKITEVSEQYGLPVDPRREVFLYRLVSDNGSKLSAVYSKILPYSF